MFQFASTFGRLRAIAALVPLVLVWGCVDAGGQWQWSDTAPPELPLVQEMRIDGHEQSFVHITRPALGPGAIIALDQRQDGAIRFFDANGAAIGSFGRLGSGPGEFNRLGGLSRMGWVADTLWVVNYPPTRMTLVAPTSPPTLARTVPLHTIRPARPAPGDEDSIPEFASVSLVSARYPDGSLHALLGRPRGPAASRFEGMTTHARMTTDGIIRKIIARYPEVPEEVLIRTATSAMSVTFPWVVAPISTIAGDGSRLAIATPSVEGPHAGTFHVLMLGPRRDTIYSRRFPFGGVPIPRSVADSVIADRVASAEKLDPELGRAYRKEVTIPPVYPPLARGMVLGRDGTLWIRLTNANGQPFGPYLVLDPTGEIVGRVLLRRGTIIAVDERRIWARESDGYGVPSVVRYALDSSS